MNMDIACWKQLVWRGSFSGWSLCPNSCPAGRRNHLRKEETVPQDPACFLQSWAQEVRRVVVPLRAPRIDSHECVLASLPKVAAENRGLHYHSEWGVSTSRLCWHLGSGCFFVVRAVPCIISQHPLPTTSITLSSCTCDNQKLSPDIIKWLPVGVGSGGEAKSPFGWHILEMQQQKLCWRIWWQLGGHRFCKYLAKEGKSGCVSEDIVEARNFTQGSKKNPKGGHSGGPGR